MSYNYNADAARACTSDMSRGSSSQGGGYTCRENSPAHLARTPRQLPLAHPLLPPISPCRESGSGTRTRIGSHSSHPPSPHSARGALGPLSSSPGLPSRSTPIDCANASSSSCSSSVDTATYSFPPRTRAPDAHPSSPHSPHSMRPLPPTSVVPVPGTASYPGQPSPRSAPGFPESSSASSGMPLNTAQHRLSFSGQARPRRASPLLHEIQPPARRLSAHQVLLLTPFGGAVVLPDSPSSPGGMRRESSSMGVGMSIGIGIGSGTGGAFSRRSSAASARAAALDMGREGSSAPVPTKRRASALAALQADASRPPRTRHSLTSSVPLAGPSPLAISQPLTTIASTSEHGSNPSSTHPSRDSSRDPEFDALGAGLGDLKDQGQGDAEVDGDGSFALVALSIASPGAGTVAMTRSNSLPVLTLRELEAMKEKDGELGIERGGDWAWVSRESPEHERREEEGEDDSEGEYGDDDGHPAEEEDADVDADPDTDAPEYTSTCASSTTSLPLVTPPAWPLQDTYARAGFEFSDPFASATATTAATMAPSSTAVAPPGAPSGSAPALAAPVSSFRRTAETSRFATYRPVATSEGYSYGAGMSEARRMSEVPNARTTRAGPGAGGGPTGDADADGPRYSPRRVDARRPSAPLLTGATDVTPRASPRGGVPVNPAGLESPRGTPLPSPARPRILRYKTSPARYTGLGLSIVVPASVPANAGVNAQPHAESSATGALSTVERRERRHARLRARGGAGTARTEVSTPSLQHGEDAHTSPYTPVRSRLGSWTAVGVLDGLEAETYSLPGQGEVSRRPSDARTSVSSLGSRGSISGIALRSRGSGGSGGVGLGRGSGASSLGGGVIREDDATTTVPTASSRPNGVVLLESTRGMSLSEFGVGPTTSSRERERGRFDSLDSAFPRSRMRMSFQPSTRPHGTGLDAKVGLDASQSSAHPGTDIEALHLQQSRFDTFPRRSSLAVLTQLESFGGGMVGLWTKRFGSVGGAGRGRTRLVADGGGEAGAAASDSGSRSISRSGSPAPREWYDRRGSWADGWTRG